MHSNISSYSGDALARINDGPTSRRVLVMLRRDPLPPFETDLATTYGEWWGYLRFDERDDTGVETLTLEREERQPMTPRNGWPLEPLSLQTVMSHPDLDAVHMLVREVETAAVLLSPSQTEK